LRIDPPLKEEGKTGDTRFFGDGGYFTPDGKARFVAVRSAAPDRTGTAFPLVLNTGRVRDHWHTMTRTAKSLRLSQHIAEPFAEIHPVDAARHDIRAADIVRVTSSKGSILVRALLSSRQRDGSVFVPMHWTDQFASGARVDRLVPASTDPTSGQPASKHVAVAIERFPAAAYGFAVLASRPQTIDAEYWAAARCAEGWRVELAFAEAERDWRLFAEKLFGAPSSAELLSYQDVSGGQRRYACFEDERLVGALFLDREPVAVPRNWAAEQLALKHGRHARLSVLAARPGQGTIDRGATVCSCFGVGANQIAAAAAAGCATIEAVGKALQAGTNCGSCRAEIKSIIDAHRLQAAEYAPRQPVADECAAGGLKAFALSEIATFLLDSLFILPHPLIQ
jgi:assimilatory nitrate reductase catalytic subunit